MNKYYILMPNLDNDLIENIRLLLKTKDVEQSVGDLISKTKQQEKELEKLRLVQLDSFAEALFAKSKLINNINFVAEQVDLDTTAIKKIAFKLKEKENLLMILAGENKGKATVAIMITDDLVKNKGLSAKILMNEITSLIGGGGGGQANFATAGGNNPNGIKKALEKVKQLIK